MIGRKGRLVRVGIFGSYFGRLGNLVFNFDIRFVWVTLLKKGETAME